MQKQEKINELVWEYVNSLSWASSCFQLTPLNTNSSNQTYQLVIDNKRYFVKHFGKTHFIPFDRKRIFNVQGELSEHGFAARPISLSSDKTIQIEEWVQKTEISSRKQMICTAATILAQLHQVVSTTGILDLPEHWQQYLVLCSPENKYDYEQRIEQNLHLWRSSDLTCLCHHDLSFEHLSSLGSRIVYDWEYAAMSNPYFDLASAIEVNHLSKMEIPIFLNIYQQHASVKLSHDIEEKVSVMEPVVTLTAELWWEAYNNQNEELLNF